MEHWLSERTIYPCLHGSYAYDIVKNSKLPERPDSTHIEKVIIEIIFSFLSDYG